MRLHYISPSTLPSRSANSVHVALQCEALAKTGAAVRLYAKRSMRDSSHLASALRDAYGIDPTGLDLVSYFSAGSRAISIRIAALALRSLARRPLEAVVSRNLYASYMLSVVQKRRLIFETHQLEYGPRKRLQRAIMTRPWVTTVAISNALVACLGEHHQVAPSHPIVLHDAAPDGIVPLAEHDRRPTLLALSSRASGHWDAVCGYFGHLYPGRGVEIIEAMAAQRPRVLFLVYGGTEADIVSRRRMAQANVEYAGHVPHPVARRLMQAVDVLLMPYQEHVSIGVEAHDTARWMSPMKMFEYLAAGVPIISSDLPALTEVLTDGENCVLVPAAEPLAWIAALDRLVVDRDLGRKIGRRAHSDYRERYTWSRRARAIIDAAAGPT
jgi:hypothetical protein